MAVSSHRIHTIHGAFGAPSCFAPSMPQLAINPAQASSFTRIPNVCAPRARPFRAVPGASNPSVSRTAPASSSASSAPSIMGPGPSSAAGSRPRRTSLSFSSAPTPTRRAPPPPPVPAERTAPAVARTRTPSAHVVEIPTIEDPFADALEVPHDYSARTQVSTYTIPVAPAPRSSSCSSAPKMEAAMATTTATGISAPPGLGHTSVPSARDIRGRLVASALLNRGSGRPLGVYLRRRLSGQEHVYVKSGLSQLVAAAA